ncbi:Uncharacterised protein [Mycobacteroides abscessus subsp. abscessus]|nr:Uncharacterised protein [Mycobacteroides abscessus subsp. abscessus]
MNSAVMGESARRSATPTVRSNLAVGAAMSSGSATSPAASISARGSTSPDTWVKAICTSGSNAVERAGDNSSMRSSKFTSACAKASRSVVRTDARKSSTVRPGSTSVRSTNVLTNMPTRSARAESVRPVIGVPMTTSPVAASRDTMIASAACRTMKPVVSWSRAKASMRVANASSTVSLTTPASLSRTEGRGRSLGRSVTIGSAASCVRQ